MREHANPCKEQKSKQETVLNTIERLITAKPKSQNIKMSDCLNNQKNMHHEMMQSHYAGGFVEM